MEETTELSKVLSCDDCGREGAFAFTGATLCPECYQLRGACCAESEMEDDCDGGNSEQEK